MKISMILLTYVLALTAWGIFPMRAEGTDSALVSRVVDGDTLVIQLNGQEEKVRLIGVDTPELHESQKLYRDAQRSGQDTTQIQALGRRASDFVKTLVRSGEQISLEYDQQQRDKYGRLLAFVWLADGRLLNEVIICEGYSPAFTRYPYHREYQERFRTCAQQARVAGKGLWSDNAFPSTPVTSTNKVSPGPIQGNRRSKVYHLPSCPGYDRISPQNVVPFTNEGAAQGAGYRKAGNCP